MRIFHGDSTPSIPRLAWLNGKTAKRSVRLPKAGHLTEHTAALVENASRIFATEINKAFQEKPNEPVQASGN